MPGLPLPDAVCTRKVRIRAGNTVLLRGAEVPCRFVLGIVTFSERSLKTVVVYIVAKINFLALFFFFF